MAIDVRTEPVWVGPLFEAVHGRPRPEDVAKLVLTFFPDAPHKKKWRIRAGGHSYMGTRYFVASPLTKSANVLAYLLGLPPLSDDETLGPELFELLGAGRKLIGAAPGDLDFRHGRLDRAGRKSHGIEMSRRRYNKLFRLIRFLETEREHGDRFVELCNLMRDAKTGVLRRLTREEFGGDASTALFVAYMASRLGMRSEFTIEPQARAFDDLGDSLLQDLFRSETANWFAVAHVFPRADVLARLSHEERLRLFSYVLEQMRLAATVLKRVAEKSKIDIRESCTVRRGQDSSSWNAAAGAWNKARDTWLGLSGALGLDVSLMLPGKVPRLMAADVVAWQRSMGRPPHHVELVAAELPMPWEVLLGEVPCTADDIRAVCSRHGVDPEKEGWTAARGRMEIETWRPTPELVHGVTVGDPFTAMVMRRLGWFSGPAKWEREGYGR